MVYLFNETRHFGPKKAFFSCNTKLVIYAKQLIPLFHSIVMTQTLGMYLLIAYGKEHVG